MIKKIFQPLYIAIFIILLLCIILLRKTPANQPIQSSGIATTSVVASSSKSSSSSLPSQNENQTYSNVALGFSFDNPYPGTWTMTTNNSDGSLVSFGPKTSGIGVGLKVYYWPGSEEFPLAGKINTIIDLRNAVMEEYKGIEFTSISMISSNGLFMVEVQGLTTDFKTTDAYFVLLPSGTLNFGGTGDLSNLIHKI